MNDLAHLRAAIKSNLRRGTNLKRSLNPIYTRDSIAKRHGKVHEPRKIFQTFLNPNKETTPPAEKLKPKENNTKQIYRENIINTTPNPKICSSRVGDDRDAQPCKSMCRRTRTKRKPGRGAGGGAGSGQFNEDSGGRS
jgi:hypothetical protein